MKIGMVGGIGPESTTDYYQRLIRRYRDTVDPDGYPQLVIDSIDMTAMLSIITEEDWDSLAAMLLGSIDALHKAGAGLGFIASNTPHVVFDKVQSMSPIPLVSIVESALSETQRLGIRKAALLGTGFTMRSGYYQAEFERCGIALAVPNENERNYIEDKLFSEIELGVFRDDTREGLLDIVRRMIREDGIDGVILGCTELPLILTQDAYEGVSFINTTAVHVERVMDKYREMTEQRGSE